MAPLPARVEIPRPGDPITRQRPMRAAAGSDCSRPSRNQPRPGAPRRRSRCSRNCRCRGAAPAARRREANGACSRTRRASTCRPMSPGSRATLPRGFDPQHAGTVVAQVGKQRRRMQEAERHAIPLPGLPRAGTWPRSPRASPGGACTGVAGQARRTRRQAAGMVVVAMADARSASSRRRPARAAPAAPRPRPCRGRGHSPAPRRTAARGLACAPAPTVPAPRRSRSVRPRPGAGASARRPQQRQQQQQRPAACRARRAAAAARRRRGSASGHGQQRRARAATPVAAGHRAMRSSSHHRAVHDARPTPARPAAASGVDTACSAMPEQRTAARPPG